MITQLSPGGTFRPPRIQKSLSVNWPEIAQKLALAGRDVQKSGKVFEAPCLHNFERYFLPLWAIFAEFSRQRKFPQARNCVKVTRKQGIKPRSKECHLVDRGQK